MVKMSLHKKPVPKSKLRLSVTSLSQYIRLENCERFLRLRLCPDEEKAMLKRWGLTIQPLTPLLRESGTEFEEAVATEIAKQGEQVVDLDGENVQSTIEWLNKSRKPTTLLQPVFDYSETVNRTCTFWLSISKLVGMNEWNIGCK